MPVEGVHRDALYAIGPLTVEPLTPLIGALVRGFDVGADPDDDADSALREALRRHKVLFLREKAPSQAELVAFGRRLGPLQVYDRGPLAGESPRGGSGAEYPEVRVFEYGPEARGREAFWHFDVLPGRTPAEGAILHARRVPDVGGDTLFCDAGALYDGLPPDWKRRLEGATGVYDFVFERQLARHRGRSEAEVMALAPNVPLAEMPLVLVRVRDRRKVLFVNPGFLVGIRGRDAAETRAVLAEVRTRIANPELQCRYRWRTGDVALWDNRACLHFATSNYFPARRTMERVTLIGGLDDVRPAEPLAEAP